MRHTIRRNGRDGRQRQSVIGAAAERQRQLFQVLLWCIVALTIVILPCTVSVAGLDSFRAPKEYMLRGSAVLIAGTLVLGGVLTADRLRRELRESTPQLYASAMVLAWTIITTATSLNRRLSLWALLYVTASAIFFIGTSIAVRDRKVSAIYVLFLPAIINVLVLIFQELRLWDLYSLDQPSNRSALIGNPNDVGAFLLTPAVAAAALYIATTVRRLPHLILVIFLGSGIVMTRSVTAIVSYVAAIVAMSLLRSWKSTFVTLAAIVLLSSVLVALYKPMRDRVILMRNAIERRDYSALTSYRLTAFVSAIQMFAKHPLTGVGPGCYGWLYYDEKIAAEAHYPILQKTGDRLENFAEAHSDHLQVLAVSGLPGYAILAGTLVFLGSLSLHARASTMSDFRTAFSSFCSLPLAAGIAVLMIAQFPLELAASTVSMLYGAALCTAWRAHGSG
jgi:O-antigen ligase